MKKLEKNIVKVWKIHSLFSLLIYVGLVSGFIALNEHKWHLPFWTYFVGGGIFLFAFLCESFVFSAVKYRNFSYDMKEDEIEVRYGLFVVKHMVIPMNRVQNVKTEQGPILKKYGLSSLHISTAANTEKIPGLLESEATSLRNTIANLAKVDDDNEE